MTKKKHSHVIFELMDERREAPGKSAELLVNSGIPKQAAVLASQRAEDLRKIAMNGHFDLLQKEIDKAPVDALTFVALDMISFFGGMAAQRVGERYGRKIGGITRLKNDGNGKQAAKASVFEWWQRWQQTPGMYAGPTAFSRAMIDKFPELSNSQSIMQWCRDWKSMPHELRDGRVIEKASS